jgi:hypothetical protein
MKVNKLYMGLYEKLNIWNSVFVPERKKGTCPPFSQTSSIALSRFCIEYKFKWEKRVDHRILWRKDCIMTRFNRLATELKCEQKLTIFWIFSLFTISVLFINF